jgi:hypothetical protein
MSAPVDIELNRILRANAACQPVTHQETTRHG